MFSEAWKHHRCIVPASFYYEWKHPDVPEQEKKSVKMIIKPTDAELVFLCGLYKNENGLPHFVILTREASDSVKPVHDRMPLILPEELIDKWIDPFADARDLAVEALMEMTVKEA